MDTSIDLVSLNKQQRKLLKAVARSSILYTSETKPIADYLESMGLVSREITNADLPPDSYFGVIPYGISITPKGRACLEYKRQQLKTDWKNKIIGFVFGVVATIIGELAASLLLG